MGKSVLFLSFQGSAPAGVMGIAEARWAVESGTECGPVERGECFQLTSFGPVCTSVHSALGLGHGVCWA